MPVHEYKVEMACSGCSGAVERVLKRLQGVDNVTIDLEKQQVLVTSALSSEEILAAIVKTGKKAEYIGSK